MTDLFVFHFMFSVFVFSNQPVFPFRQLNAFLTNTQNLQVKMKAMAYHNGESNWSVDHPVGYGLVICFPAPEGHTKI